MRILAALLFVVALASGDGPAGELSSGKVTLYSRQKPGNEKRVYVEVANSSTAHVVLEGEFVDANK